MSLKNKSKIFPVTIVAVDGKGGAGKSTLGNMLGEYLNATVIHSDDFTSFEEPAYDGADLLVEKVFDPIMKGERNLSYSRLQVWPGEPKEIINQPVTEIMILEGCGASCEKFRPYISYTVAVELDDSTRYERVNERDVIQGGRSPEESKRINKLWDEKEREYFAKDDPTKRADVVVTSALPFNIEPIVKELSKE